MFWGFGPLASLHFCDFWDLIRKPRFDAFERKESSGAQSTPGRREKESGCQRSVKAGLQCSYVQTRSDLSERPLDAPRTRADVQKPPTAPGVSPSAALRRRLGVLCVLESGEKCSLKMLPGNILAVLAFGAVSLRVLDLGVPYVCRVVVIRFLSLIHI